MKPDIAVVSEEDEVIRIFDAPGADTVRYASLPDRCRGPLHASTAEQEQHHDDDQDHTEYANPATHAVLGISVVTPAQTAKQDQQNDDDQDCVHDSSSCDGP